jgi:hypothetical protein
MDPVTLLAVINGAISIIEAAAPGIQAAVKSGEISPDVQAAIQARIAALHLAVAFSGPEWQQSATQAST